MNPKTKKGLVVVSALAIGGFLLFKMLGKKNPKAGSGAAGGGNTGGGDGFASGVSNLDFRALSNDVFDALDGYGTNEEAIENAFNKLQSDADLNALIDAYGVRTVSSGALNVFQKDYTGDLFGSLKSELNSTELDRLNQILANKGITKRIM